MDYSCHGSIIKSSRYIKRDQGKKTKDKVKMKETDANLIAFIDAFASPEKGKDAYKL